MAASKLWSNSGSRSAAALIHGAASGDRCLTISSEGSTAQTTRSVGSYEPLPAPTLTTVRALSRADMSSGRYPRVGRRKRA